MACINMIFKERDCEVVKAMYVENILQNVLLNVSFRYLMTK